MSDVMIRLDEVHKRYDGQAGDAVAPLSMEIREGEFVVFVGPSGCGKTTTLRMINRMVEPSGGRIWIDGRDVTDVDPDELRKHIGYVIQQVGLIPHLTVAANVGLVPKLLGWQRDRIEARTAELLDLVGLDPAAFGGRYPKQLSGGQQQRVGVARALAADPPVMLMDEPFGAIDPITRARLQEEFLALQRRIRKTIVFVTHDVDEALRLGDRVAVFGEGSRLVQFDTPLGILTNPADDYVRDFLGSGAAVRRLGLLNVGDLRKPEPADRLPLRVSSGDSVHSVLERMLRDGADRVIIEGESTEDDRELTLRELLMAGSAR
ncbi:ABC transporter ATP-binding protein [Allokutzneria sp. A3M-2-11 16]|uniref:ABC transporter ATP-binding protein n=1 Tax=Allokutzneria sp. A3M-2-11 16 TaxID=2962043 RepID=UPI0020B8EC28|nr:ABC transporter ATP-binding protein [Allokutzneria sp. A3M-2-11 16]MCP3803655.1 ABC transporter ATP-binding protein [Allokutzneria sp. A3M-2-11 16]